VHTARGRFAELQAVRAEASSLQEALESRKVVERAKGLLMAKEGITEDDAYGRIRRASQRTGRPMRAIADALVATLSGEGV
jgi:response regulator NasT